MLQVMGRRGMLAGHRMAAPVPEMVAAVGMADWECSGFAALRCFT
jgi:hypothetical protein